MTSDKITLPELDDDMNGVLNHLLDKLDRKQLRNDLRKLYYDGRRVLGNVRSGVVPPQYYRMGIVLGWSAKAVDILARRCNLDGFVWPGGDLDSIGGSDVWEDNHLGSEVNQALVSSLIHSVAFVVNTQGGDGEPDALIHFKDAFNAAADWDPRRRRLDNLLTVNDRDKDGRPASLTLYLDGTTWVAEKDGDWAVVDQITHGFGVPADPLVYRPRLGRPFGSSRISRPVMSLQDQALRTVIRMEAHSDIYAIPDLWMFGADESIFKNADGSQKSSWQVMMGRLHGIPDDEDVDPALARASVQQITASDPEPHLKAFKQQAQMFSGETSIPLTSLGVSDMSNPTSADSYIASREDLISEAEGATDDWRPALRRRYITALAMAGGLDSVPDEWKTIDTKWRSPIHLSRAAQADAGQKTIAAVPWLAETEVGLEQLGLDEQQVKRAMAEKRRLAGRGVLDQLRAAAQQPASGSVGAVDQG